MFGVIGDLAAEPADRRFGRPRSRSTKLACIFHGRLLPDLQAEADDAGDGRLTGRFLTIPQHLSEKSQQHNGGVINAILAKHPVVLVKDSGNLLGSQDRCKRQPRVKQESINDLLKSAVPEIVGIRYRLAHEKTLPGICGHRLAREGFRFIPETELFNQDQPQVARVYIFFSRDQRPDYALPCHTTVPFVSGTVSIDFRPSLGAGGDFQAEFSGRCGRPCFIAERRASIDAATDRGEFCVCLRGIDMLQPTSISPKRPCRQQFLFCCRA